MLDLIIPMQIKTFQLQIHQCAVERRLTEILLKYRKTNKPHRKPKILPRLTLDHGKKEGWSTITTKFGGS